MLAGTLCITILYTISVCSADLDVVWARARRVDSRVIWEPILPSSDYFIIGQFINRTIEVRFDNPAIENPDKMIPVARSTNGGDELAEPTGFIQRINYTSSSTNERLLFWSMICPSNYVAFSGIAVTIDGTESYQQPDTSRYRCVRQDLTRSETLLFYFYANGIFGIWPMSVIGNSIGSFYTLARPSLSATTMGFRLKQTPRNYEETTTDTTSQATEVTQATQLDTTTTTATATASTKSTSTMPTITQATKDDNTLVIIIVTVVIIVSTIVVVFAIVWCSVRRRRRQRKPSSSKRPITHTLSTEPSDFVYQEVLPLPSSGSAKEKKQPQESPREMRINVLYEGATEKELTNTYQSVSYVETVINPLYAPGKRDEV